MDFTIILQAGIASGTVLLFATIGELFAERSGVMNLGVEGMMLVGAMSAFSTTIATGNPWLGVLVAMLFAGLLSQIHAFIVITLQGDQVVSGLSLTFLGAGISLVLGEGLEQGWDGFSPAKFLDPFAFFDPDTWKNIFHQSKRTCLYWLSACSLIVVLHKSHTARIAFTLSG